MQKMSEKEAAEALKRLFGECELDLPGQDSLEVLHIAIAALEEIQQYQAIGTVSEVKYLIDSYNGMIHDFGDDMDLLEQYKAIGTVEECREAVERMKPKKPIRKIAYNGEEGECCPTCGLDNSEWGMSVCVDCGQRLDWEE